MKRRRLDVRWCGMLKKPEAVMIMARDVERYFRRLGERKRRTRGEGGKGRVEEKEVLASEIDVL